MEKRERFFQRWNPLFAAIYAVGNLSLGIYYIILGRPYYYLLAFAGLLLLFIPTVLHRLFHLQPVYQLNFAIYLFCFLLYTVGLIVPAYSFVPYYDKFAHTLSGVFFTLIGLGLFYLLKTDKKMEQTDFALASVFSLSFSVAIAGLWEISEYIVSILFGTDPQNVLVTGVADTMLDMIVCTAGSLIFWISMLFYYKKRKTSLLMGVFETFYQKNIQETTFNRSEKE